MVATLLSFPGNYVVKFGRLRSGQNGRARRCWCPHGARV